MTDARYLPLVNALRKAVVSRAQALDAQVSMLTARYADAPAALRDSLALFHHYAKAVEEQANSDVGPTGHETAEDVFHRVNALMIDLQQKIAEADERFARGSQEDVPRWLSSLLDEEIAKLNFGREPTPVLSIGPPGSFETRRASVHRFLFHAGIDVRLRTKAELHSGAQQFALVSVPQTEGRQVLWNPVLIGHEVGHLFLFDVNGGDTPGNDSRPGTQSLYQRLTNDHTRPAASWQLSWIEELLCDLNAVCRYGPAALAAVCEMLTVLRPTHPGVDEHPPRHLRTVVMVAALEKLSGEAYARGWWDPIVDPWQVMAYFDDTTDGVDGHLAEARRHFADILTSNIGFLLEVVRAWRAGVSAADIAELKLTTDEPAHIYDFAARGQRVQKLAAYLLDARTCGVDGPASEVDSDVVLDEADIVNAAWYAVMMHTPDARADVEVITRLAGKSIDTAEFVRLVGEGSTPLKPAIVSRPHPRRRTGSVLSRDDIVDEMIRGELVIDPLMEDELGPAGVDLRVGPEFITFQRTSTAAYDPLSDLDYSAMQKRVSRGWHDMFVLHPGELVLASSLAYIVLPAHLTGDITSRSSYGRLGLLTVTAAQVQPWSRNCITLELVNAGMTPIELTPGLRIAQLRLHRVAPVSPPDAKYSCAVGPEFPRVHADRDRGPLRSLRERHEDAQARRRRGERGKGPVGAS